MDARAPVWLAVAAAVAVPLAFDPASARPFVGPKLVVALGLGALAPAALVVGARPRAALLWAFGAHAAALGLATTLSLAPAVSIAGDFYRGMGLLTRLALVGIALVAAAAGRPLVVLRAVLAASAVAAAYALAQALGLDPIFAPSDLVQTSREGVAELRAVGTFGHANFLGHALAIGAGAAVALAAAEPRRAARLAAAAAGGLVAVGAVASGSRGAWVALGAEALAFAALAPAAFGRVRPSRRALALAGVALLAVAAALASSPVGGQVAQRALAFRADGMTGSGRTLLWRDALAMVPAYAAHGCGPEAFLLAFRPYQSVELERREPYALFDSPHSVALDAAIATGLAGLATWAALVAVAAAGLWRAFRAAPPGPDRGLALGLAVGLVGWAVGGLFVFDTIATAFLFYVFVALAGSEGSTVNGERLSEPSTVHRSPFTVALGSRYWLTSSSGQPTAWRKAAWAAATRSREPSWVWPPASTGSTS
jgi:O-antigen ligase